MGFLATGTFHKELGYTAGISQVSISHTLLKMEDRKTGPSQEKQGSLVHISEITNSTNSGFLFLQLLILFGDAEMSWLLGYDNPQTHQEVFSN